MKNSKKVIGFQRDEDKGNICLKSYICNCKTNKIMRTEVIGYQNQLML